jgi:CDP-diglyceride synthetase
VDILNPLVLPALQIIGGATAIGIFLTIILRLVHRDAPGRYKAAWLKLGILIGITTVLISAGALGIWGLLPVILFLACCGWYELTQCIEKKYGTVSTSLLVILLGTLGTLGGICGIPFVSYFGAFVAGWVAIALPMLLSRSPLPMHSVLGTAFGTIFISMPLANLLALVGSSYGAFAFLILIVMANDGFSEGFGRLFGKTPLCPQISPSKTWEGATGGLLSCSSLGYGIQFLLPGWQLWQVMLVTVAISLMGLTGDLIASSIKRDAGIKDFGQILGITGGILDKFDSLLFATPIFCAVVGWIGN